MCDFEEGETGTEVDQWVQGHHGCEKCVKIVWHGSLATFFFFFFFHTQPFIHLFVVLQEKEFLVRDKSDQDSVAMELGKELQEAKALLAEGKKTNQDLKTQLEVRKLTYRP